jgi:type IV pilus assembly protein PilY1
MWEYPNLNTATGELADLGYSFSKAAVVQTNDSAAPWIVIFGNGYDSPHGHAVLMILDATTGGLIKKIDTGVGACNGLSTPIAVDVDYDDKVDYVYAGDLQGNLWKFDLSASDSTDWNVAYREGAAPKPLFKTAGQPITTRPDVMYHCRQDGYLVLFGTGKYLGDTDLSDTSLQSIYAVWDYGDDSDDSEYVGQFNSGSLAATNLPSSVSFLHQIIVDERIVNGYDLRTLSALDPDWETTTLEAGSCGDNAGTEGCDPNGTGENPDPIRNAGWYLDLPDSGERVVSDVIVRDGKLIVISYVPEGTMCGTGGKSWLMEMDACSGARLASAQFDINNDGVIDAQDLINIGTEDDPIWVAPSAIEFEGRLQPPAILILGKAETKYMSSSRGKIETAKEKSAKLGLKFWRVFQR